MEKITINMNTVEIFTRQVIRDKAIVGQGRSIERNRAGKVVSDTGWEDTGGILVVEKEVSDATWWNPKTWGLKKTIRDDIPDYIKEMI